MPTEMSNIDPVMMVLSLIPLIMAVLFGKLVYDSILTLKKEKKKIIKMANKKSGAIDEDQ